MAVLSDRPLSKRSISVKNFARWPIFVINSINNHQLVLVEMWQAYCKSYKCLEETERWTEDTNHMTASFEQCKTPVLQSFELEPRLPFACLCTTPAHDQYLVERIFVLHPAATKPSCQCHYWTTLVQVVMKHCWCNYFWLVLRVRNQIFWEKHHCLYDPETEMRSWVETRNQSRLRVPWQFPSQRHLRVGQINLKKLVLER